MRTVLRIQAEFDIRRIPRVWFWRFDDEATDEDSVYGEAAEVLRKYHEPTGAHLLIRTWEKQEGPTKMGVDKDVDLKITVSLAEVARLGQHYALGDEAEEGYLPRADDVFQWRGELYTITERFRVEKMIGPTKWVGIYSGAAVKMIHDSTDMDEPLEERPDEPPQPEWPVEMRSDGVRQSTP